METTTISSKYQIVIPRKIRELMHLKPGQKLMFIPFKRTLQLVVIPPIEEARGMFPGLDTEVDRESEDRV